MLNTLRKIVQEVNSAKDLKAALGIIVQRVKEAMGTQVCSVYLLDTETQRFVLMATEGLNKRSIGKVSMAPSEGLVGLVGTREEPLNLENAAAHPRYRYFAETGEERYASFLGAPIIHHRRVMGVLVVQQKERRQFDEGEEAFLVTMSAQLAGVIAHAEATGSIRGLGKLGKGIQEAKFVGVPGAPGVGVGKAVVVLPPADLEVVPDKQVDDIDAEIALFKQALEGVRADMRALSSKLASQLRKEERALFDVYLMMLDDASIGNEVKRIIRTGQWAQGALRQVVMEHVQRFELMDDAYLRERASDVKDIGRRLLAYLQEERKQNLTYPEQTIIVSEELSPAMLGEVPEGRLVGLVSVLGSGNSHVAILARAMGIPTVMGAVDLPYSKVDGIDLIVDGYHGEVYTNPSAELVRQYSDVVAEERELSKGLAALRELPCETLDGHRMPLWVNTGLLADVARAQERGAEGVDIAMPPIGMMVEIPAAVYQTRELARQVDFLSVGSNDLTQYLLAVDRNNPRVADLYDYLHPAVLHALKKVVDDAHLEGKPVSICGEMAGDPAAAVLLMAMGFDSLSMNATNLPKVKWLLRQITLDKARDLLGQLLTFDNPQVIHSSLHLALRNLGLGRVINPAATVQP